MHRSPKVHPLVVPLLLSLASGAGCDDQAAGDGAVGDGSPTVAAPGTAPSSPVETIPNATTPDAVPEVSAPAAPEVGPTPSASGVGPDPAPSDTSQPTLPATGAPVASSADPDPTAPDAAAPLPSAAPTSTSGPVEGEMAEWSAEFPSFERREIAAFSDGYYTSAFDVDGDGLIDVAALSSSRSELVWFKNPSWERFGITTNAQRFICMDPYDVDGDGDLDLAFSGDFDINDSNSGGSVYWAEAPDDPTTDEEWTLHEIDAIPTTHRLFWADIDGNGKKELLNLPIFGTGSSSPEHVGAVRFTAYTIADDPTAAWSKQLLDDSLLEVAHGISVVDWDGDAAQDILTASNAGVHLFQPGIAAAPRQLGAGFDGPRPDRGSSEVALGALGSERFIATIEPWHGTDAVVYTPGPSESEPWTRNVLGSDFQRAHALLTADLNGDGFDEIIGGDQNGGGAVIVYRYLPAMQTWEKLDIDRGEVAVIGLDIADLDGDGRLDLIAVGGSSNNLVWFKNTP